MTDIKLTPIEVTGLTVESNPCDVRRDLYQFVNYIAERDVKRAHRSNMLSKSDANRLAKLMSDPLAEEDVKEHGQSVWIDFVDDLALSLNFVQYDTKGEYMGYTSSEPSFPDNYIEFKEKNYHAFLGKSLQEQEQQILDTLVNPYHHSNNEFFSSSSPFSLLDSFDIWGCATGILPTLNFAEARHSLLNILKECESEVWYSTASLIQYLKVNHPFFLLYPKLLKPSFPRFLPNLQQNQSVKKSF